MRTAPLVAAAVLAAGLTAWVRRRYVVVTVDGLSMFPAYRQGERLLVRRTAQVRRGDCVVFTDASKEWIVKRVVAVPGDPVPRTGVLKDVPEPSVPAGRLVALGDNQASSYDSRHYGFLDAARVLGVVLRPMAPR